MHGGGGAPAEVNDKQWQNQISLYQPAEGIYMAPRAPTDTWNLWHQDHIDVFFALFIQSFQEAFVCCLRFRTTVFIRIRNQIRNQESALKAPESLKSLPPG